MADHKLDPRLPPVHLAINNNTPIQQNRAKRATRQMAIN